MNSDPTAELKDFLRSQAIALSETTTSVISAPDIVEVVLVH